MVWFPGDDLFAATRPRGLPIGNLTSQFWANCLLSPFDHFVKRELRCPAYIRYVDDFMLFARSKEELWDWLAAVVNRLAGLRLTMHPGSHPKPVSEGIPFLGFITWPDRRRLKARNGWHFRRTFRRLTADLRAACISPHEVTARVQAWVNHVRYANSIGLRKAVLGNP